MEELKLFNAFLTLIVVTWHSWLFQCVISQFRLTICYIPPQRGGRKILVIIMSYRTSTWEYQKEAQHWQNSRLSVWIREESIYNLSYSKGKSSISHAFSWGCFVGGVFAYVYVHLARWNLHYKNSTSKWKLAFRLGVLRRKISLECKEVMRFLVDVSCAQLSTVAY